MLKLGKLRVKVHNRPYAKKNLKNSAKLIQRQNQKVNYQFEHNTFLPVAKRQLYILKKFMSKMQKKSVSH